MLLHASTRWPDVITTDLWTFATNHAVDKWNATPRANLNFLSPDKIFAGVTVQNVDDPKDMSNAFHTFKSVLVFKRQLHNNQSLPKFDPHA